jgi:DNA-binding transcriptional MerR regulator
VLPMNTFTIRDIENLSGIKAHTLRVWEQRYGIIKPMRKDSNHRLYGIDDLKKILRISYLYNEGYKISRIAEMSDEEIRNQALEYSPKGNYDVFINQLMESSIDFDDAAFRNAMDAVLLHLGVEKAMTLVIYPFFHKVGMLWVTGNIIPAQEHFATNIIRNKIILATSQLRPKKIVADKKYVIFCPPGEFHEIPVLFVQYSLRMRGIQSVYFGVNTDMGQIRDFLEKNEATHLFLHLITNFSHLDPGPLVNELNQHFPGMKILASGRAFKDIQVDNQNTTILETVQHFISYLDNNEQDK